MSERDNTIYFDQTIILYILVKHKSFQRANNKIKKAKECLHSLKHFIYNFKKAIFVIGRRKINSFFTCFQL